MNISTKLNTSKIILTTLVFSMALLSCKKEEQIMDPEIRKASVAPTEFRKEIVIYDESGENSVDLAIISESETKLNSMLKNFTLKLQIEDESIIDNFKNGFPESTNSSSLSNNYNEKSQNPQLINNQIIKNNEKTIIETSIHIINNNFKAKSVKAYSIEIKPIKFKNEDGTSRSSEIYNSLLTHRVQIFNRSNFMGVTVSTSWGYAPNNKAIVRLSYFNNWYSLYDHEVFNGILNGDDIYHAYVYRDPDIYGTRVSMEPFFSPQPPTVKVVTQPADYRGRTCSIGGFDGSNCHVGFAPSGTSAFIWGGCFYYTFAPGFIQCPYPGSYSDGSNCFVANIPDHSEPFLWANGWYVRPNKLYVTY